MNVALITYSHSDYKDVWPMHFGQTSKYLPDMKKYMFVDQWGADDIDAGKGYHPVLYDEADIYTARVISCLDQIDDPWVIFSHEDQFLYDKPDLEILELYRNFLEKTGKDFVRLIKCGEARDVPAGLPGLREIPMDSQHIFSLQPTMWRLSSLKQVFGMTPGETIWEFEIAAQNVCRTYSISGFYPYFGESKRGNSHWDSKVYPYVATALSKGRWNVREYQDELARLFDEYGVDSSVRGYFR